MPWRRIPLTLLLVGPLWSLQTAMVQGDERPRCTIMGTRGNDELIGTPGPDVICGFGGNDDIYSRQGADIVYGGRGHDVLVGRSGRDRLYGGRGADAIKGSYGDDLLSGQRGSDCLGGAEGTRHDNGDTVRGGPDMGDHYSFDPGDLIFGAEIPNLRCRFNG